MEWYGKEYISAKVSKIYKRSLDSLFAKYPLFSQVSVAYNIEFVLRKKYINIFSVHDLFAPLKYRNDLENRHKVKSCDVRTQFGTQAPPLHDT